MRANDYPRGMGRQIVIRHSELVRAPIDDVFRYTQDYTLRPSWDRSIRAARILTQSPTLQVRVVIRGGHEATFVYKAERESEGSNGRVIATSVSMSDIRSWLIAAGGGSWRYEERDGHTLWTQVMSLTLKPGPVGGLLRPWVGFGAAHQLRRAMRAATARLATSAS